jgi:putative RNA 2'-phosphotransferase
MNMKNTSKFIALLLRHHPEIVGLVVDEHGWADVKELITKVNETGEHDLSMESLEEIVASNDKTRFSFNKDKTKIRANHGHSIQVDVELEEVVPPEILYHGTAEQFVDSIDKIGLIGKERLYVHLSEETKKAIEVGGRHGKPVLYEVSADKMIEDGYKFYLSKSNIWLTKEVPTKYLRRV